MINWERFERKLPWPIEVLSHETPSGPVAHVPSQNQTEHLPNTNLQTSGFVQAVSSRLPTPAARIRSQVKAYEICGGQSCTTQSSLANSPTIKCSILIYHSGMVPQANQQPTCQVDSVSPTLRNKKYYLQINLLAEVRTQRNQREGNVFFSSEFPGEINP